MEKYGRLELIIGPMYASKTTELIKISNRYKSIQKNIIAVNHKINNIFYVILCHMIARSWIIVKF